MRKYFFSVLLCCLLVACKSSAERAQEYYESGAKLVQNGDASRALVEFRNALQIDENHHESRRAMGAIELERGKWRRAYGHYLHLTEQNPNDVEGRIILSELAFTGANWEEFDRHSKRAIELAPEQIRVKAIELASRYRTAALAEDRQAGAALLTEAETLMPSLPDSKLLRQILTDGYVIQQKYDLALVQVEKSIEAEPDNLQLYGAKLELLNRLGDRVAVENEMRHMVKLFPENQNIKQTLLRYLIGQGSQDKAEDFLRELIAGAADEDRDAARTDLIQFLLRTRGVDVAMAALEQEITTNPTSGLLKALRGSMQFDIGERDEGVTELQTLLSDEAMVLSATERQNVKVALAKMLLSQGNEVGARKHVEEILSEDGNAVGALKMQAGWLIRDDKTDEAINTLRTALDQAPEDVEAMTLMAEAYQRSGDKNLMRDFLLLAVENSNNAPVQSIRYARALIQDDKALQAESILIDSLRVTPGNIDVLQLLGQVYLRIEDLPRAAQVVETLRQIDTDTARLAANGLNVEVLARQVGPERALDFLNTLTEQPGNEAAAAKLAILRNKLTTGAASEALSYAKDLVAEDGTNLAYRNALALTYAASRDFEAAETEYRSVLEDNDTLVSVWLQLSRVKLASGDVDGAIAGIEEGLEKSPGAPDLLWGQASFMQRAGNIEGAITVYEELYNRFSNSTVVANNLASLLSAYRSDEESITRAQVISRRLKDADVPAFQDTYGWIEHLNGNSEDALNYLEPAAKGLPNDPSVQIHLGMVYAALGRKDEALTQLRKAVEQAGILDKDVIIQSARDKISELESQ